jgi:preprotein translocase subunit SecD
MEALLEDKRIRVLFLCVSLSLLLIFVQGISTGLDLQGGSIIQIQAERSLSPDEMEQVTRIMDERLRGAFGVRDVRVRGWGNEFVIVEIAGVPPEAAEKLIGKPGKLVVRIGNRTAFTGDELTRVETFRKNPSTGSWEVPFSLTEEAAIRFRDVAVETDFAPVNMYLDEGTSIAIYSDRRIEDPEGLLAQAGFEGRINVSQGVTGYVTNITLEEELEALGEEGIERIVETFNATGAGIREVVTQRTGLRNSAPIGDALRAELLRGQVVKGLVLELGSTEPSREEAKRVEVILRSGALPIKVEVVGSFGISATLGEGFAKNAILAGLAAFLGVALVIFFRYREPRVALPILLTGVSEVIIIFGFAALIRWNIDLPAIAGIIATLGTGVDNQIVILDEILLEKKRSVRRKIQSAFFMIMSSYLTVVAAMVPLFIVGLASLKGFAFTTIIGATAGVFVTRPAYARILQYLLEGR